jgi:hypothetical protein
MRNMNLLVSSLATAYIIASPFVGAFMLSNSHLIRSQRIADNSGDHLFRSIPVLNQSIRDDTERSTSSSSSSASNKRYDEMPWSTNQEWALQDKISTYTINIPTLNNPTLKGGGGNKSTFVLWHTMRKEVTELMGYEIDYLQKKYSALLDDSDKSPVPGVLPYIDEFEFRSNGGIKGRIYGLVGIESGTEIVTSPLKEVELTLPKGFVLTGDGSCAYELGTPKSEKNFPSINFDRMTDKTSNPYSMDLSSMKEDGMNAMYQVGEQSGRVNNNVMNELGNPETSQMIVNLAGTTAVVLSAATAMGMLSHHLTVNVFWV